MQGELAPLYERDVTYFYATQGAPRKQNMRKKIVFVKELDVTLYRRGVVVVKNNFDLDPQVGYSRPRRTAPTILCGRALRSK